MMGWESTTRGVTLVIAIDLMWGCKKDDGSYDEDCLSAPVFNLAVERIRAKLKDQRGIEVDRKHVIFTTDDPNPEYLWVSIWAGDMVSSLNR
jgi:hypothetical protein